MPSMAFLLEQVWVHMSIFVNAEGKMVADCQCQIDLANGVGCKV
jgi:hypothetical protein